MEKSKIYNIISRYLKKNGAKSIAIFGSYARNQEKKNSDIDILVEFIESKSLFELSRIERELSEKINIKVDLVTKNSISPYIKESVNREMVLLS